MNAMRRMMSACVFPVIAIAAFILSWAADGSIVGGDPTESTLTTGEGAPIAVDAFGNIGATSRYPQIGLTFEGNTVSPYDVFDCSTGDGAISQAGDGIITLTGNTGTACFSSVRYLRYEPGIGIWAGGTFGATGTGAACYGLWDGTYGTYICIDNGEFKAYRSDGTPYSACEVGCDEALSHGLPTGIDLTKPNIWEWSMGYYGVRDITLSVSNPLTGAFETVHTFKTQGSISGPHIGSPRLPMRASVTAGSVATSVSVGAGTMQPTSSVRNRVFCYGDGPVTIIDSDVESLIVAFRVKSTFEGRQNTITATVTRAVYATNQNGIVLMRVRGMPSYTGTPTWTSVDSGSVVEYSTDMAYTAGTGITLAPDIVTGARNVSGASGSDLSNVGLYGNAGGVFAITSTRTDGTGDREDSAAFCWSEGH